MIKRQYNRVSLILLLLGASCLNGGSEFGEGSSGFSPSQWGFSGFAFSSDGKPLGRRSGTAADVIACLSDDTWHVREYACHAITQICDGSHTYWDEFQRARQMEGVTPTMARRDEGLRFAARRARLRVLVPLLVSALDDSHSRVRLAAARGLREVRTERHGTVRALEVLLRDPDVDVRLEAVKALLSLGRRSPEAVNVLQQAMATDSVETRADALVIVGKHKLRSPAIIKEVERMKEKDVNADVRRWAEWALREVVRD